MKNKTNNNKKVAMKKGKVVQDSEVLVISQVEIDRRTAEDFRNALLVVSIFVNLIVLIFWLILQVTTVHDYEIAALLFNR